MKIKNSLMAFVLTMMVLFAGSISFTSASPAPPSCASVCLSNFTACKTSCNGDPGCLAECQEAFDCCRIMCHGHECLAE